MRQHFYLCLVLLLISNNIFGQSGGFDPSNPPEPNALHSLNLQASPNDAGSFSGAGKYAAGTNVRVYADNNAGFKFKSWKEDGNVISTASSFNYMMPAKNVTLTAVFEYDPNNPAEPNPTPLKYTLNLVAQPSDAGSFNISNGNKYEEGSSIYLYANTNNGFKFKEWRDGDNTLSTDRNYYYLMPAENKTITAVYYFDPGNPSEPNTPTDVEHGLIALTQSGEIGRQIAYPIYLLNHNIDVYSVEFDIAFPENAAVDTQNAALSGRTNGHSISVTQMNDTLFHVLINSETNNSFFDSNGVLLTVPVTIPAGWNPGETHPVTIRNVILGTHSGTIASSARNGTLSATEGVDPNVYAGFYSTKFLNRVLFTNLSSETATGFLWDFGDGNTSTEREPLHVYETSGNYDVCLKAYNTFASDSAKLNVSINPENLWNISGILSLNKHKKEVKNYTSPDELFQQLSQATITGDMIINVEAGETFEYALTSASVAILTGIKNQLAAGNYKLVFQKEGDTDNPVINFDGVVNKESITAIIQWGQYIEIEQVDIKISGIKIDITKIYDFTNQEISSGATSVPVDFTAISNAFSYNWTIVSAPEAITGYSPSGTNVIPAMVLTNNSLLEDTVKYKVSIFLMELELYAFEYQIIVLPDLPDLQVTFIEIPNNIIESKTFIIDAIITNTGKNIVEEKSRTDGIWRSEESVFDMQTASLIGTKNTRQALAPNESYTISFELTAPADSMGIYYYFVAADMDNNIRESDETNNRLGSNPVTIYPNMMDETDYLNLVAFYTNFGGASWINRHWDTTSLRIGNKWAGVTFDNGRVTKIELPSNNVTGELSDTLYRFPYLTTLNLYDNRLSGNLSNLFGSDNRPDSLVTLNLGKNQLTGTIPASISNQVYLRTLNLSYNQLTDMEDVLPENIVQPDLQYQSFKADSITLSSQPLLPIPLIAHYNHAGRNFDFNPSWQLYRSNDLLLAYYPEGDMYRWNVLYADEKDFEWKYDSGSEFNLFQTNGLTAGSSMPVKIYFDKGDTNIDNEVDILDVQHSLNYMFNEHQSAFNYTAADTYPDSMITVQDLITTVNIILDTDTNYTAKRSFQPVSEINNKLFIENGQLILYAEQPVAASDITLQGISNNEISPVLDGTKFQYIFRNQAKGTRLIFFSPAGDVIPSGYTVLAELSGKNVRLVNAVLASRDATRLPVSILTTPMNLSPVNTDNLKIRANGNVVHYYLPWNVDNITATLYTIQGEAVSKQTMNRLVAGNHEMNFNITHQGVYILNTTIHLEGQIISKNIKLVVLK